MPVFQTIRSFLYAYRFSVFLAIAILVISLLPGNRIPDTPLLHIRFMDKYIHFAMYAVFSITTLLEMKCGSGCLRKDVLLFLFSGIASLCIEIIQGVAIEGRSADWTDLLANLSGLIAGWLLSLLIRLRRIRS
jgi:glycopeptide antibiotics resistance protein